MTERLRHFLSALWVAITGLTLAQINALLGFISLAIGISYQLWKWRKEARVSDIGAPVRPINHDQSRGADRSALRDHRGEPPLDSD